MMQFQPSLIMKTERLNQQRSKSCRGKENMKNRIAKSLGKEERYSRFTTFMCSIYLMLACLICVNLTLHYLVLLVFELLIRLAERKRFFLCVNPNVCIYKFCRLARFCVRYSSWRILYKASQKLCSVTNKVGFLQLSGGFRQNNTIALLTHRDVERNDFLQDFVNFLG